MYKNKTKQKNKKTTTYLLTYRFKPIFNSTFSLSLSHLTHLSLLGMVAVYESILGYAMISVTSGEWECMTLSLKEPMQSAQCLAE